MAPFMDIIAVSRIEHREPDEVTLNAEFIDTHKISVSDFKTLFWGVI